MGCNTAVQWTELFTKKNRICGKSKKKNVAGTKINVRPVGTTSYHFVEDLSYEEGKDGSSKCNHFCIYHLLS